MKIYENFSCQIIKHGTELLISIQGDLDMYTTSSLQDVVWNYLTPNINKITIDCDGVKYVDSAFLQFLTRIATQVETVRIINASRTIRKIFKITGLEEMFMESED